MSGFPALGSLYLGPDRNGLPVWSQPGGPGTLVYPQLPTLFPAQFQGYLQTPMAYPALYYLGCGHPSNCLEIFFEFNETEGEQYALVCCGQCSYIQEVMPSAQYYNYIETPIVVA